MGALRRGEEGVVGFEVGIGVDGQPTRCEIVKSSGHPDLDSQTCTMLMLRAKFRPAMHEGKPVESSYRSSVRWMLPADAEPGPPVEQQGDLPAIDHQPLDIVPGDATAEFVVGVDGKAADCKVSRSGAPYNLVKPVLALCWRGQAFVSAHDAVRRPVKRKVKVRIVVETEDLPSEQGPVTP
jgi:TonB family protein